MTDDREDAECAQGHRWPVDDCGGCALAAKERQLAREKKYGRLIEKAREEQVIELRAEVERLRGKNERLREALRPFVAEELKRPTMLRPDWPDDQPASVRVANGDIIRAYAALASRGEEGR